VCAVLRPLHPWQAQQQTKPKKLATFLRRVGTHPMTAWTRKGLALKPGSLFCTLSSWGHFGVPPGRFYSGDNLASDTSGFAKSRSLSEEDLQEKFVKGSGNGKLTFSAVHIQPLT